MKYKKPNHAFTLIELLVVIAIIILLLGILVPTVTKVLQLAYVAKSRGVVTAIQNAAEGYFNETKAYYPGQRYKIDNSAVSGSQVLAACLLNGITATISTGTITGFSGTESDFSGNYLSLKDDTLVSQGGQNWCLADGFPSPMAVIYYPSTPGNSGSSITGAFDTSANALIAKKTTLANAYQDTLPTGTSGTTNYCWDENLNLTKNYNTFLLAAPGADRKYFLDSGTTDDLRNFNMD